MPKQSVTRIRYRGPIAVFFLVPITLGVYGIVWHVTTKGEMNRLGAKIPTAWLLIVPFANIWWLWKYAEGVEEVTNEGLSTVGAFFLLLLLGSIGMAIVQNVFNTSGTQSVQEHTIHSDTETRLHKLFILKQKGIITEQEFQAKKKQLLEL